METSKISQASGSAALNVASTTITAMADSGAQSCLWSMDGFRAAGFSNEYLIPVNMDLVAANKSPISIEGAALLRLQGFYKGTWAAAKGCYKWSLSFRVIENLLGHCPKDHLYEKTLQQSDSVL